MSYPYSWTPTRVVPWTASQVTVLTDGGARVDLATPVSVTEGTLFFALEDSGSYVIEVRSGNRVERGRFTVDITGVDTSTPEWIEYEANSPEPGSTSSGIDYVTEDEIRDPNSPARAAIQADMDAKLALAIALAIAL